MVPHLAQQRENPVNGLFLERSAVEKDDAEVIDVLDVSLDVPVGLLQLLVLEVVG